MCLICKAKRELWEQCVPKLELGNENEWSKCVRKRSLGARLIFYHFFQYSV